MASQADTQTFTSVQTSASRGQRQRQRQAQANPNVLGMDRGKVTQFLGWFSVGLGLAELIVPRTVAKLAGTRNHSKLIRSYGIRELGAGIGLLSRRKPGVFLWSRVAGDAVDITSLAGVLASRRSNRGAAIGSLAAVAGITALDVLTAQATCSITGSQSERAEASLIINRSPQDCYRFWRDFENLSRFLSYIQTVRVTGDRTSHWIARVPGSNTPVEWDSEITDDRPDEGLSWQSTGGSAVSHSGSVQFEPAPHNRGTIVRVQVDYGHPGQAVVSPLARLAGKHPEQMIYKDLRRFKQVMETGEVIRTEGQPAGRRSGATWLDQLAR
jgi:uncharacterized membrane protein